MNGKCVLELKKASLQSPFIRVFQKALSIPISKSRESEFMWNCEWNDSNRLELHFRLFRRISTTRSQLTISLESLNRSLNEWKNTLESVYSNFNDMNFAVLSQLINRSCQPLQVKHLNLIQSIPEIVFLPGRLILAVVGSFHDRCNLCLCCDNMRTAN